MHIINWFNSNSEFVNAILSFSSFLLSGIAIIVSIRTARFPYRKKIKIKCAKKYTIINDFTQQHTGFTVTVTNIGARMIVIECIGIILSGINVYIKKDIKHYPYKLQKGDALSESFDLNDLKKKCLKMGLPNDIKLYGFVDDSEGCRNKEFLCIVGDLNS